MRNLLTLLWLFLLGCCSLPSTMGQQLVGSETPQPAHLLRPRNFNHHPYESRSHVHHRQDYIYGNPYFSPYQYQLVPVALPSSPERNPYNILKGQRDYLSNVQNDRDRQAFSALAKTAQKLQQQPESQDYINRKYAFEYTANDIYHTQQQDDQGLVKGSYEVPLPDGRVQIVKYFADADGYHPEISYKGEVVQSAAAVAAVQQSQAFANAPVPVRSTIQRGSVVVYPNEDEEQVVEIPAPRSYYTTTTVSNQPQAVQYNNYGLLTGLPKPYGTVKTVGQVLANPSTTTGRYAGRIQYATYEDVVDAEPPSTQYYEK